jgi:elongation factor Ts
MITAQAVKELRERSGVGMMDCKKALTEADGDMEKAIEILREKGLANAVKKAGRIAAEGLVGAYVSEDGKKGSIVEVNCETDFVAKNQEFIKFVSDIAKQIVDTDVNTLDELLQTNFEGQTLDTVVKEKIAKIGEKISVRRFEKFNNEAGVLQSYIHGERIGVMVQLNSANSSDDVKAVAKEVALQVAANNPVALTSDQVPADKIETEKEIARTQALESGKPANIVEKMVEGRVKKYFKEVCLLEQAWVKDADKNIETMLKDESKRLGTEITINRFVRFEKGEGIEKREDNFVEEVMKQMGK